MLCSVSVSAYNIVTLLLAWHDCQNGTLDSINNSVHPPLPTHVQAHMHRYTYMHIHSGIHTRTHARTHTNTYTQNKHTHSQSPFNVYPHGDTV